MSRGLGDVYKRQIYHNLSRIYEIAERDAIPTYKAADRLAAL